MQLMLTIIRHFFGLLTLKNKPQDLSYSLTTLIMLLLTFIMVIKFTLKITNPQLIKLNTLIPTLLITYKGLFLTILFFFLSKIKKQHRFVQSACNFLGINIINYIFTPIINFFPLQLLLLCLLKAWLLMVNFHITKHVFNVTQLQAIGIYLFLNAIAIFTITLPISIVTTLTHA